MNTYVYPYYSWVMVIPFVEDKYVDLLKCCRVWLTHYSATS